MSSTPGVGGEIWSMGLRTMVPEDEEEKEEEDTGFRSILWSPCGGSVTTSRSPGSLCLIELNAGIVASECFAPECRASRLASAERICIGGVSYRLTVVRSSLLEPSEVSE